MRQHISLRFVYRHVEAVQLATTLPYVQRYVAQSDTSRAGGERGEDVSQGRLAYLVV